MTQVMSFSADKEFATEFDDLIRKSGYKNRSRFIRDAALFFAEIQQRGDLMNMKDEEIVEGHLVVHYQHGSDQKLMVSRTVQSKSLHIITAAGSDTRVICRSMWSMSRERRFMFDGSTSSSKIR